MDEEKSNISDILESIQSCIDTGNHTATGQLLIGVSDTTINRFATAFSRGSKTIDNDLKEINETIINTSYDNSEKSKLLNDGIGGLNELLKNNAKQQEAREKNIFNPLKMLADNFPKISAVTSSVINGLKILYDIQTENLNNYKSLLSRGVLYQQNFDQLHRDAGMLGLQSSELVTMLTKNSDIYAKLGGLTGDSRNSFLALSKAIKETSIKLGMDFNTSVDIASSIIRTASISISDSEDSFQRLISTTNKYQVFLQKLSLATGKSIESILAEQKAREDSLAFNVWSNNGQNKPILDALTSIGASSEIINAFVTGMPNEAFTTAAVSNPEMGRILTELMAINKNYNLSTDKKNKLIFDLFSNANKELLFEHENLPLNVLNAMPKDWQTGQMMGRRIATGNWKEAEAFKEAPKIFQSSDNLYNKLTNLIENLKADLTLRNESINTISELLDKVSNTLGDFTSAFLKNEDNESFFERYVDFFVKHPVISGTLTAMITGTPIIIGLLGQIAFNTSKFGNMNNVGGGFSPMGMLNIGAKVAGAGYHGLEAYNNFSEGNTIEGIYQTGSAALWAKNPILGGIVDTITDTIQIGTDAWINGIDSALDDYKKNGNNYLIKAGIFGSEKIGDLFYDKFLKTDENENDDENDIRMREIYGDKWDELKESLSNKQEEAIKQLEMMNQQSEKQVIEMKSLDEEKRKLEKEKQQNNENFFNNIDESLKILNNNNNKNNNEEALKRLDEIKDVLNEIRVQNEQKENLTSY